MRFFKSDSGYALVLTLLFMPVFIGMSLLVIDISRGNNAQSDLQAAADALALAGARELDGGVDSIDRAIDAMSNVSNTVSFLGRTDEAAATELVFAVGEDAESAFTVVFLSDLPENDDTPLTQAFLDDNDVTNEVGSDQGLARFVYVRAQSRDLSPFFGLFFEGVNRVTDVPVAAQAVATFRSAACDVTPLFICNPFEGEIGEDSLQVAFAEGRLHGRLIRLLPRGNGTAFPGNFGLLASAEGNGVDTLREVFATGGNRTCYDAGLVETQPGRPAAVRTGINVRFDMYQGPMNGNRNDLAYAPAANVRRGFVVDSGGGGGGNNNDNGGGSGGGGGGNVNWCNADASTNDLWAQGFPDNAVMPTVPTSGASIGQGNWDLAGYWAVNHPGQPLPPATANSRNGLVTQAPGAQMPSRYDIYRYEIESPTYPNNLVAGTSAGDPTRTGPSGAGTRESGLPQCTGTDETLLSTSRESDRRIVFAAIIDCLANADNAGRTTLPVNSFASIFLVNPMQQGGANVDDVGVIDVEIVDITGAGSNGTLDTFVRDEANLVR
ncbi:MAG: pilus assembly protein TadG-related protein [Paracoccaceae bacterium]|nr:pilus assembly protein TadG-related protein [Paracoccaceae bacterium]